MVRLSLALVIPYPWSHSHLSPQQVLTDEKGGILPSERCSSHCLHTGLVPCELGIPRLVIKVTDKVTRLNPLSQVPIPVA